MANKKDDKKVDSIGATKATREVTKTSAVEATEQVGKVDRTSSISAARRRATNLMTQAEREKLLAMIEDEAEELSKQGVIPKGKAGVIAQAVKMAVDSGIIIKDDDKK